MTDKEKALRIAIMAERYSPDENIRLLARAYREQCDFPVLDVTPPEPREDPLNINDGFDANEDKDDLSVMGMR